MGSGDAEIAAFAESIERAVAEAYEQANERLDAAGLHTAGSFADHHRDHHVALGDAAGDASTGEPNAALLEELTQQIEDAADDAALLGVFSDLEAALTATHLFLLGAYSSTDALQLTAAILPIEAQHVVAIGATLDRPLVELAPSFENTDRALTPEAFPLE